MDEPSAVIKPTNPFCCASLTDFYQITVVSQTRNYYSAMIGDVVLPTSRALVTLDYFFVIR